MLGFFREQVLGPLLYRRAGRDQRGVRRLEGHGLDKSGKLIATIARHDPSSVREAIKASIALYLYLRADDPLLKPTKGMPELLGDFIDRAGLPAHDAKPGV